MNNPTNLLSLIYALCRVLRSQRASLFLSLVANALATCEKVYRINIYVHIRYMGRDSHSLLQKLRSRAVNHPPDSCFFLLFFSSVAVPRASLHRIGATDKKKGFVAARFFGID